MRAYTYVLCASGAVNTQVLFGSVFVPYVYTLSGIHLLIIIIIKFIILLVVVLLAMIIVTAVTILVSLLLLWSSVSCFLLYFCLCFVFVYHSLAI